jgi:hypothetical protein
MIGGALIGSAAMYFMDPDRGRSRRAIIRDRAKGELRSKSEALNVMTRDFQHRVEGMRHEINSRMAPDKANDAIIEQRVCSAIGHACTHNRCLDVNVKDGVVQISGPVLASEAQAVIRAVRGVRGVTQVHNLMTTHESAAEVPEFHNQMPPATKATATTTPARAFIELCGGGLLALYGIARRGVVGNVCGLVGAGMIARAFHQVEARNVGGTTSGKPQTSEITSVTEDLMTEPVSNPV